MPISAPTNTLAHQLSRPLTSLRSYADQPCSAVAQKINDFMSEDEWAHPDSQAILFYAMNHGLSLIAQKYSPYEPMEDDELQFVKEYHQIMTEPTLRAAYYLILICVRESRHMKQSSHIDGKLDEQFGYPFRQFIRSLPQSSHGAENAFRNNPPNCTLGRLAAGLAYLFHNGPFTGSFGGHPWGNVADCLSRFVNGEFSAEMMLDTNWTLCHNNGPIFNKGMLYHGYTGYLPFILDVQRSGQIPELILEEHPIIAGMVSQELKVRMEWLKDRFPDKIGDYCDWFKAETLGAVNHLGTYQQVQKKKHGPSPYMSEHDKAKAAAEEAAKQKWKDENLVIVPGALTLKKFKPVRKVA